MATSGLANRLYQHGLQIDQSIATYIFSSGMSVFVVRVDRMNLEILCFPRTNTTGGITTYIERSAMPTPWQPVSNSRHAMFTEDSMGFDTVPVLLATALSPTSSIQCRSSCLTTSRGGLSTSSRRTNGSTSPMQSGYPCLLTTTSHQKISHIMNFLNGMGRR
jgi:hypothetical protein